MSRDVYLEGQGVGKRQAKKHLAEIHDARTISDLGAIAGSSLEELLREEGFIGRYIFSRTIAWKTGFIDGFVDQAQELKNG